MRSAQAVAIGVAFLALTLGWLGPALDHQDELSPDTTEQQLRGEIARFEAEARARCARWHGENGGAILLADGVIVCSDKHGRGRHALTATLELRGAR